MRAVLNGCWMALAAEAAIITSIPNARPQALGRLVIVGAALSYAYNEMTAGRLTNSITGVSCAGILSALGMVQGAAHLLSGTTQNIESEPTAHRTVMPL